MKKINATIKGVITGVAMIAALYYAYSSKLQSDNFIFVVYLLYTGGIVWTLFDFKRSGVHNNKFKEFFNQGFRCFIVVTLFMVIYTFAFYKINIDESALSLRESLIAQKNKTPSEIEADIKNFKENYPTLRAGFTLFQYLVIGALVAGVASAFFTQKNRD